VLENGKNIAVKSNACRSAKYKNASSAVVTGIIYTAKTINTCTKLYHSFIQYTGSYMFRQWSVIIRELLGFV
jgi:hypothetical protein